jgi:hypothetical protein
MLLIFSKNRIISLKIIVLIYQIRVTWGEREVHIMVVARLKACIYLLMTVYSIILPIYN